MHSGKTIAVVIPAYNVAAHISGVVASIPPLVDRIYVVNDASRDQTAAALAGISDPRLTVITHQKNQGVGGATVTGFKAALASGTDVIVKMDGDGQMDPAYLSRLVDPVVRGEFDYAKGNRFLDDDALIQMPRIRLFGNLVLTFLTKLASGYWHIFDPQNGYLAADRAALARVKLDHLARRYFFENDMLVHLNIAGARVTDVPIPARYGEEASSMRLGSILLTFPPRLLRRFWYRVYQRHVLRDFSVLAIFWFFGALLLAWGIVFGLVVWAISINSGKPATTGTVMLSALPLILGFQLVLQAILIEIGESRR
jgi:dolichol-phosphate mannosyltransferase